MLQLDANLEAAQGRNENMKRRKEKSGQPSLLYSRKNNKDMSIGGRKPERQEEEEDEKKNKQHDSIVPRKIPDNG